MPSRFIRVQAAELLLLDPADIDAGGVCPPETGCRRTPFVFHCLPPPAWQAVWQRLSGQSKPDPGDIQTLPTLLTEAGWYFSGSSPLSLTEQLERLLSAQLHLPWTQI